MERGWVHHGPVKERAATPPRGSVSEVCYRPGETKSGSMQRIAMIQKKKGNPSRKVASEEAILGGKSTLKRGELGKVGNKGRT